MVNLYLAMERDLLVVHETTQTSWQTEAHLVGMQPTCIAADPLRPERVYCGTFGRGLWGSEDAGHSWQPMGHPGAAMEPYDGLGIPVAKITALAVSHNERHNGYGVVYAGTEPASLFRSEDGGATWHDLATLRDLPSASSWSFPPRPYSNLVRSITPDPHVTGRIFVAIEAGALVFSPDGGNQWHDRTPDSPLDTHTLLMHPLAPNRLYSAAGDGLRAPERGYNESYDAGATWHHSAEGRDHHYLWGMAIDPADPETVLVSASPNAYRAHHTRAEAYSTIYRKTADSVWQEARQGLPAPHGVVAPVLATNAQEPHTFYALTNKGLHRSQDAGQVWASLPVPWQDAYLNQHQQALLVVSA
ncbi:MAG: glycosyl hydrolase [Ardenticatenales bacterium]|nr:glycosyl hydrolase [Ardenticatenales bacterium]